MHRTSAFKVSKAFEIDISGVFAAGDAVSGPATVVQAVAHGNKVALAVDAWLTTGETEDVYYQPKRHDIPQLFNPEDYAEARRPTPEMLSPRERLKYHDFQEVELGFDASIIQEECKRCLRCDLEWLELIGQPMP
jgi:NADPH-dependent glutamate synthase beta subunit-like oxidoreductase